MGNSRGFWDQTLDFLRARVASSSLEAGNAALAPLLVMEPQCRVCQAGAGLRSGIVLGSSEQNQTQSPCMERWSPKLSLLEKQSWKKTLPPPAWLAAQPVWVLCLWAPKGACSKALNVSGF